MAIGFKGITLGAFLAVAGGVLGIGAAMTVLAILAPTASAQETVLDAVEDVSEHRSGDFHRNRSIFSQIQFITGMGGFPEQRIHQDTAALAEAHRELMVLQTQNTATVRVPDLPNPYTTSVQLLPTSQLNSRVVGSELNFEPLPRR
jgi:hypothetical protein